MRRMRMFCLLLTAQLLLGSCGYHFAGEGESPRPGLASIAIPLFENGTGEPQLEYIFASALRNEFLFRSQKIKVVPTDQAEVIFRGRILSISSADIAHRSYEQTTETRLTISVNVRVEDSHTGKVIWTEGLSYYEDFYRNTPNSASYESRRRTEEIIAREIALRIHDHFMSNF